MTKATEIKLKYYAGVSVAIIAKEYNLSRQRIYQLINGYTTIANARLRKNILARDQNTCTLKRDCGGKLHIHHINGDSHDNSLDNLITLCDKCHKFVHKIEHLGERKGQTCIDCKGVFLREELNTSIKKRRCLSCYEKYKAEKQKYWNKKYKLFSCIICKLATSRPFSKGRCERCWRRIKYSDPKNKELQATRTKNWRKRHPEFYENFEKQYHEKWRNKNKERLNLQARKRYAKNKEFYITYQRAYRERKKLQQSLLPTGGAERSQEGAPEIWQTTLQENGRETVGN